MWAGVLPLLVQNAAGRITNNWSTYTWRYWGRTRRPDPTEFEDGPRRDVRSSPAVAAPPDVDDRQPAGV